MEGKNGDFVAFYAENMLYIRFLGFEICDLFAFYSADFSFVCLPPNTTTSSQKYAVTNRIHSNKVFRKNNNSNQNKNVVSLFSMVHGILKSKL